MVLNFKEEFRCSPMTLEKLKENFSLERLLEPFNPIMNLALIFIYLAMEITFFVTDEEDKICFVGHIFGLLSGFMVGFIVLDNKVVEPWETTGGKCLICFYTLVFLTMIVLHISNPNLLANLCWDSKKAIKQILNPIQN